VDREGWLLLFVLAVGVLGLCLITAVGVLVLRGQFGF
jgi:hypothetical protein